MLKLVRAACMACERTRPFATDLGGAAGSDAPGIGGGGGGAGILSSARTRPVNFASV